jgi:signal transduction histidine kinase
MCGSSPVLASVSRSRNLVELQGGEVVVASEKGKGSTFSFTMPVSEDSTGE